MALYRFYRPRLPAACPKQYSRNGRAGPHLALSLLTHPHPRCPHTQVQIPPRVFQDECVACRITHAGSVIGYRNHAHRLARDIWSDPFDLRGEAQPPIGRFSAQDPQIIRMLPAPRALEAGQVVELHCQYDARQTDRPTFLGLDERSREMCNQYYISTAALRFSCDAEKVAVDPAATSAIVAAAAQYGRSATGVPIGQVTAVAADARSIFFFHRGPTDFTNTQPLQFDPIVRYDRRSRGFSGAFGRGLFIVPHGLYVDHQGMLWATDVATHQVLKLDPGSGGRVVLKLGDGRAATGHSSFNKPTDVAVERASGDVYVADGYGNSRIVVFSSAGAYLREWGSAGTGKGEFRVPHSIALDSRGLVYVADRENSRVQVTRPCFAPTPVSALMPCSPTLPSRAARPAWRAAACLRSARGS